MRKITVREYDQLYSGDVHDFNDALINDLSDFIQDYSSRDCEENILDFANVTFKKGKGKVIVLKNYVGVIQLHNKVQIQILPKIDFDEGEDTDLRQTKRIFLKMLKCLDNYKSKSFLTSELDIANLNIFDIFISMYLSDIADLVKKGLKLDYVTKEENTNYLKGRILINEQIKHNRFRKEKMYCEFDEYDINRPENKLIKAALAKLTTYSTNIKNKRLINQLLTYFDFVEESKDYENDFKKIKLTRDMANYIHILEWTKIFLENKSFTSFSGENNCKSLLFPMDSLFEAYVAKQIKKQYIPQGFTVKTQDKRYYLFDNPKRFLLKPDIVMERNESKYILDTKWKRLINNQSSDFGISQSDLYQMFAYGKKYNCNEIYLIYPHSFNLDNEILYVTDDIKIHIAMFDFNRDDI